MNDLLTIYLPTLKGVAINLTKSVQDAEDLMQDTAEKMIRARVMDKPYGEQKKICNRAISNTYFDSCKKGKRASVRMKKFYHPSLIAKPTALARLELKEVMKNISLINPKHSKSLLAFAAGYTMREINKNTNIAVSNISYARKALLKLQ